MLMVQQMPHDFCYHISSADPVAFSPARCRQQFTTDTTCKTRFREFDNLIYSDVFYTASSTLGANTRNIYVKLLYRTHLLIASRAYIAAR